MTAAAPVHPQASLSFSRLLLVCVLGLAVALRCWSIDWGAPYVYHPDEHSVVHAALNIVRTGDPNPHWFRYPSLLIYLEAGAIAVLQPIVGADLTTDPAANRLGPWDVAPRHWPFVVAGRIMVAAFAVIGVGLVYWIGARLTAPLAGVAAALFLAASPLHNASGHYLTTDVPAMAFISGALLLSLGPAPLTGWRLVAAGFTVGLAAGTKYPLGIAVALPLGMALGGSLALSARRAAAVLAAAALGFLLTTPYAALDAATLWRDLVEQRQHYMSGPQRSDNWAWYVGYLYRTGLGWPLFWLAGLGVLATVVSWRHSQRRLRLLCVLVPLVYLAYLASYALRFERNLMPLLPFVCVLAADALWVVVRRFLQGPAGIVVFLALAVAVALPGVSESVRFDRHLALPDTRTVAREWISLQLAAGSRIAREEYTPQVDGNRFDVIYQQSLAYHDYGWYVRERIDYLVLSSNVYGRLSTPAAGAPPQVVQFYQLVFARLSLVAEFVPNADRQGPVIRIYMVPHA